MPPRHTDVNRALARYLEWAQDAIASALAVVLLVIMVQAVVTLWRLALAEGREPFIVLPQILLLLIQIELFRTLLYYLREHRVAVSMMIEVALVSVLRELLISQPGTSTADATAISALLLVLGALLVGERLTRTKDVPQPEDETS